MDKTKNANLLSWEDSSKTAYKALKGKKREREDEEEIVDAEKRCYVRRSSLKFDAKLYQEKEYKSATSTKKW